MSLLIDNHRAQLLANGRTSSARNAAGQPEQDFGSIVKLFTPDAGATWLLAKNRPRRGG